MAVAVQLDFEGMTLEQYDEVCGKMGLSPRGPGPAGSISHFAALTESGLRVVDVWETREQFDAFAADQIGPNAAAVGVASQPSIQFFEVHNYFTAGS